MRRAAAFLIPVLGFVVLASCPNPTEPAGPEPSAAGEQETFSAEGVSFVMVHVPGKKLKTGTSDGGTATVSSDYQVGETEVTYQLWSTVYTWATGNGYSFQNPGNMGDGAGDTDLHPVTCVSWRDVMVWCNAATEWYNAINSTTYDCVYTYSDSIVRSALDANAAACDNVSEDSSASGFRLLTSAEWELAARYKDDLNDDGDITDSGEYYPGDFASGATADYSHAAQTDSVAWHDGNSEDSTHTVKDLNPNALGLYDISGNAAEWCFDLSGSDRVHRGGGWNELAVNMQVGASSGRWAGVETTYIGFRLAMNY
jgi:formylglycine-generating enzyme required for sulfatase activity